MQISVSHVTGPTSCPLCRSDLPVGRAQVCEGCGTAYHRACLFDLGGCGTIGCPRRGQRPASLRPVAGARAGAGAAYLVVAGVALATTGGLVGLSRLGVFLHRPPARSGRPAPPPVAPAAPQARPRPSTPPAAVRPTSPRRSPSATSSASPAPGEATPVGAVAGSAGALEELTRAVARARSDLQLLEVCAAADHGTEAAWARGLLEARLAQLDAEARAAEAAASEAELQAALRGGRGADPKVDLPPGEERPDDPVAVVRRLVREARAAGATEADVEAALRGSGGSRASREGELLAALAGRGASPLAPAALAPRLRRAIEAIDREATRYAAASAYADALERSIDRDQVVARLEGLLRDPEVVFQPAEWRERFAGSDPHEVARAARRRFVAAGGQERPDPMRSGQRPMELLIAKHLETALGVLSADDDAPTPTQRLLAEIDARAAQPRPR